MLSTVHVDVCTTCCSTVYIDRSCDSYCLILIYSWLTRVRSDTRSNLAAVVVTHPKPFTCDEVIRWWLMVDVRGSHDHRRST